MNHAENKEKKALNLTQKITYFGIENRMHFEVNINDFTFLSWYHIKFA